jgi:outer membrane protein TolC
MKSLCGKAIVLFAFAVTPTVAFAQGVPTADQIIAKVGAAAVDTKSTTAEPEKKTDPSLAAPDLSRVGVQAQNTVPLALDDAIRRALQNNNNIELTRDDVRFQEQQVRALLGLYDPVFTITPTFTRNSITGSTATKDFNVNANLNQLLPSGGNYSAFFNNTRTENAFAQAQVSSGAINSGGTSAIFSSQLGVRYTQPLFRNFRIDNTRRNIRIARRRLEQTDADFRRQAIEIISQVQRAYWDLVFALRDQQNRAANLQLTQENMRQVEARIAAGASAPLARAEVATELANRESEVLIATQQVSIAENNLKQLVLRDAVSAEWSQSWMPTDRPVFAATPIVLDEALKDAMDNRFELRRLKFAQDINAIDIDYFRNQTKPQIDLVTTFSLDGLSRGNVSTDTVLIPQFQGNDEIFRQRLNLLLPPDQQISQVNVPVPGAPSFFVGGFNRSLANIFRSEAPNYSIGVTISFPFRNRTAKANLAGAEIQKNQIDTQIRAQEQVVIVEVRNAVQAVETARQRVLTARRARENAEIQLEGERKLYEAGRSTTFLLFQRENALTNARNAEIRAETDYSKALSDLQRVTSTTFRVNNITVDSPTH